MGFWRQQTKQDQFSGLWLFELVFGNAPQTIEIFSKSAPSAEQTSVPPAAKDHSPPYETHWPTQRTLSRYGERQQGRALRASLRRRLKGRFGEKCSRRVSALMLNNGGQQQLRQRTR